MSHQKITERLSVIIPTYNGAKKLPCAIRGLASQTLLPAEVVVVVDGSSDETQDVLISLSRQYPNLNIRTIFQPNSGRAGAKNRGIFEASYDLLAFIDDDMEPVPVWLEYHVRHHAEVPHSIATGSLSSPQYDQQTEVRRYQEWLHLRWHPDLDSALPSKLDIPYIHAGNFSASKSLLQNLGCFVSGLTDCEDRLLALKALENHVSLYLLPLAQCTHHDTHCSSFSGLAARAREYEKAREHIVMNEPSLLRYEPLRPFTPKPCTAWIYAFFRYRFFLHAADIGLFRFLLRVPRYHLYNLIITGYSRFSG